ncbi:hypothetical protein [Chlorobium phaeobacteroides]|jgi:bacteriochlorophyll C8 methyltransferase|uniref:hypothetical protein n=1 Tax=Chlorobium phaeobacteroides TaxID=1096 RepID=UPI00005384C0
MPIFQIITPYPGTQMYQNYKEKGLITNENREKYNALHLIIKSDRYEPLLFQHKVLKSYTGVYSWKHIIARTVYNPKKLINLVTSLAFRNHLRAELEALEHDHEFDKSMFENIR